MAHYFEIYSKFAEEISRKFSHYDVSSLLPELVLNGVISNTERAAVENHQKKTDKIFVRNYSDSFSNNPLFKNLSILGFVQQNYAV